MRGGWGGALRWRLWTKASSSWIPVIPGTDTWLFPNKGPSADPSVQVTSDCSAGLLWGLVLSSMHAFLFSYRSSYSFLTHSHVIHPCGPGCAFLPPEAYSRWFSFRLCSDGLSCSAPFPKHLLDMPGHVRVPSYRSHTHTHQERVVA